MAEKQPAIRALNAQLAEKKKAIQALSAQLAEKEQAVQALTAQVAEIRSSTAWTIIEFLWRVRLSMIPHGSRRERATHMVSRGLRIWKRDGLLAFLRRILQKLHLMPAKLVPHLANYERWIQVNEPGPEELKQQRQTAKSFANRPLISVVVPVFNTPCQVLSEMIESVLSQTYDNWELCIVNGSPNSKDICKILKNYSQKDQRIKIVQLEKNLGIAGNTNAALTLATGEFVGFLDHDDLLAPFALLEVIQHINSMPEVDLIYSDEDKISKDGKRYDPYFKPDFSPDMLRSLNYMPHFLVIRKSLGEQIGWIREGFDGAQDYDFILRAIEKTKNIIHITKILYHWRAIQESAASSVTSKPYASIAGKKALEEHLQRTGIPGRVESGLIPTWYNVKYSLERRPLISIIIPNHDHVDDLECCVNSILGKSTYSKFEILIVENGSQESEIFSLYTRLRNRDARISIIEWQKSFNFSAVNNWAAKEAKGEVLLFLNNDIEVINHDWLEQMLQHASRKEIGAVGAKLYYPNEMIQHAGVIVGIGGVAGHDHKYFPKESIGYMGRLAITRNVSAVTAACLMVRKDVFKEVGGFDENYSLAFGDVDLCLTILHKGYLNVWTPYAELYHHESKTRGHEDDIIKQRRFKGEIDRFRQKWSAILERGDEYYNPNLTLEGEDFSINSNPVNVSVRIKPGFIIEQDRHK